MNKIAIVSDSHGSLDRLEECLENLKDGGVKQVIHAGDFAVDGVVDVLKKFPEIGFKIARGNCDVNEELLTKIKSLGNVELDGVLSFELAGKSFAVAHRVEDLREIQNTEVYISGHTHIPQAKNVDGKLFLNPGSLMDDGGYFLLDLETLEATRKLFNKKI